MYMAAQSNAKVRVILDQLMMEHDVLAVFDYVSGSPRAGRQALVADGLRPEAMRNGRLSAVERAHLIKKLPKQPGLRVSNEDLVAAYKRRPGMYSTVWMMIGSRAWADHPDALQTLRNAIYLSAQPAAPKPIPAPAVALPKIAPPPAPPAVKSTPVAAKPASAAAAPARPLFGLARAIAAAKAEASQLAERQAAQGATHPRPKPNPSLTGLTRTIAALRTDAVRK